MRRIPAAEWFRAVVREFPEHIEIVEPPARVADPTDEFPIGRFVAPLVQKTRTNTEEVV